MKYLIKNAKVISKGSSYHHKRVDLLISNGTIVKIGKNIKEAKAKEITGKNLHISAGWLDVGTHLGEPGYEHRETMESLCSAALAGGYTDIAPFPKAHPVIQSKSQIMHLIQQGQSLGIDIYPIGPLSIDLKGENIAEYLDMSQAGAVAISDGLAPVESTGLLMRALQYTKANNSVVLHHPNTAELNNGGVIHEGMASIKMGLKGSPEIAEHITLDRDLQLAAYTDSRLCVHAISSKGAVDKIKKMKAKLDTELSCSVSYLNLICTDEDLLDFDSNLKVTPVIRSQTDQNALIKALNKGTIDYITSNHVPLEEEAKKLEFPYAKNGATGLETAFAALHTHAGDKIDLDSIIAALTTGPRSVLGLPYVNIAEGAPAKITCFDTDSTWTYDHSSKKSKSSNNPFWGKEFTARVVATINGKLISMN